MSESERRYPRWVDGETDDCQISEACRLYGIEEPERVRDKKAIEDGSDEEARSIVSEDSDEDEVTLQERINSQLYVVRETDSGRTLWKRPMKESDAIADHVVAANRLSHRLPCHSFRSMLPPLSEEQCPPVRSPSWLRCCARGILSAALQSHSEEDRSSPGRGDAIHRLRFPEHVYCWFAADDDGDDDDGRSSDEDRWAFYHGVKASSDADPEYWLAYALLDDAQGEDFFSFLARSITNIRNRAGKSWERQFGPVFLCGKAVENRARLANAIRRRDGSLEDDESCAVNVWMPSEICEGIVRELFGGDLLRSSKCVEKLTGDVNRVATNVENSILYEEQAGSAASQDEPSAETVTTTPSIDFFTLLRMIMKTYLHSHRRKQLIHIRHMFEQSASEGRRALADSHDARDSDDSSVGEGDPTIGVPQLHRILRTVWQSVTLHETTLVYREAYDASYPPSQWKEPAPDGVNFRSFLVAAERRCLFSRALLDNAKRGN